MVKKVNEACLKRGLKINKGKTKIMCNGFVVDKIRIKVENEKIEMVGKFVHLGQTMKMDGDFGAEISICMQALWTAYYSRTKKFLRNPVIPLCLRNSVIFSGTTSQ